MSAHGGVVIPDARPLAQREKAALVAEILLAYARTRWWLRRRELQGALLELRSPRTRLPAPDPADGTRTGRRLGRAVVRTLTLLPTDSRCLMRSLVLTNLLARRGIESSLVLGVHPGESFAAHAWLEHDSVPLLDPAGFQSRRLATL
jgi:hypothetical protein